MDTQQHPWKGIYEFKGRYRFLSNFAPSPFEWNGVLANTVEHHFNAAKTLNPFERAQVYAQTSAADAKKVGRQVTLRPEWDDRIRFEVMTELLRLKFSDPVLRDQLLNTWPLYLVEGNRWHDQTWGNCLCDRHAEEHGANHLGKTLMYIRNEMMDPFAGL